ncbi:MAG: hypothetical protein VZS44_11400 [Bacilli bacterium]|nr:hypothetical protein [Bacilli bacterium]
MGTTPSLTKSKIIKDIKYPTTIKEYINEKLDEQKQWAKVYFNDDFTKAVNASKDSIKYFNAYDSSGEISKFLLVVFIVLGILGVIMIIDFNSYLILKLCILLFIIIVGIFIRTVVLYRKWDKAEDDTIKYWNILKTNFQNVTSIAYKTNWNGDYPFYKTIDGFANKNKYRLLLKNNYFKYYPIIKKYNKSLKKLAKLHKSSQEGATIEYCELKKENHKYYIVINEYISDMKINTYSIFILNDTVQNAVEIINSIFANEDYLDFTYLEDFYHNAIIL